MIKPAICREHQVAVVVVVATAAAISVLGWGSSALAETYQVGPDKQYATLQELERTLEPGDVVEVDGDATYPGGIHLRSHGRSDAPITIRGVVVNGRPPVLAGGEEYTIVLHGDHYLLETFEITGGKKYCVVHKGHDITIRDVVVHDCPEHGILGTDEESGSLTLEHSEVYNCGSGERWHQIYMATDESAHPGSVFRMQFTYVHRANGGNSVKSRAERNEIYYNWIEGAAYHGLDLIGPDGQESGLAREDSDVVGNVVITTSPWQIARLGGDATGGTAGRYRFVNNTFIMGPDVSIAIRMQERVESIELHNNVFFKFGSKEVQFVRHSDPMGPDPVIRGSNNWVQDGFIDLPARLSGTLRGTQPGFADIDDFDFTPAEDSMLRGAGSKSLVLNDDHPMPKPLAVPGFIPPFRMRLSVNSQVPRTRGGPIDIGAFEYGLPRAPEPVWGATYDPVPGFPDDGTNSADNDEFYGCMCGLAGREERPPVWWFALLGLILGGRIVGRSMTAATGRFSVDA